MILCWASFIAILAACSPRAVGGTPLDINLTLLFHCLMLLSQETLAQEDEVANNFVYFRTVSQMLFPKH